MPSPLGHALGGGAIGLLLSGPSRQPARLATAFGLLACAPDLDLMTAQHSGFTHSFGFALLAGLVFYLSRRNGRLGAAAVAAYGSHVVFDWLGRDTSPPLGVMALWPFSDAYFMSPVPLLEPVSRRYWEPGFWRHTLEVVLIEVALFGGIFAWAWWRRTVRRAAV